MSRRRSLFLAFVVLSLALPSGASAQTNSVLMLLPTDGRELTVGGDFTGALSTSDFVSVDDHLLEAWELEGRAGETVTVDLMSELFDPRLYAAGPGFANTMFDDDGGGGCNARLTITFLENGTFRVVASSYGETGTYTLRVSERPAPAPTYGCGEIDPSVLADLPTEGRMLELGSLEAGILGPGSRVVQDGRPGQAWEISGQAGESVTIVLESDDFDAYLFVAGPGIGILEDDDGAGDLNSRIEVTFPQDGPYKVVASALSAGDFGAYLLRVEEPLDPTTVPVARFIAEGDTEVGTISFLDGPILEGRTGQVWGIEAEAGQRVQIDMSSDDFDTYLYLVGPGFPNPLSDDDGGDGTDSQFTVVFPEAGTYRIIASVYGGDATGSYTLSVLAR